MIKKKLNFLFLATIFSIQLPSNLFAMNPDLSEKEAPPSHISKKQAPQNYEKNVFYGVAAAIATEAIVTKAVKEIAVKTIERKVDELCDSTKVCDSKGLSGDVAQGIAVVATAAVVGYVVKKTYDYCNAKEGTEENLKH